MGTYEGPLMEHSRYVAESGDEMVVICHYANRPGKERATIYTGSAYLAMRYAATYMDRDSVREAWQPTAVEVVWNGHVVTTFVPNPYNKQRSTL